MLAVLSLLSALVVVVLPRLAEPAEASTGKWTGRVTCDGQYTDTGLDIEKWDKVKITATGSCFFYPGAETTGEGLYSYLGERLFTTKAPASATAPTNGRLKLRLQDSGHDNNYGDGFVVTVTANLDLEKCRNFTATSRYYPLQVRNFFDTNRVPELFRPYVNDILQPRALAFMQVKGTWCYKNGRVTSHSRFSNEARLTGSGVAGLVFDVDVTRAGSLDPEEYGSGATRYRLRQTTAVVTFTTPPLGIDIPIPGSGRGISFPGNFTRAFNPPMVMDTLLTGAGNGSCAGYDTAPCTIEVSAERPK